MHIDIIKKGRDDYVFFGNFFEFVKSRGRCCSPISALECCVVLDEMIKMGRI